VSLEQVGAGARELVSILIPAYNRADVIEQTVRSALAQREADIEVVVVDNASTDGTWDILRRLAAEDARVRVFRNDENIGPVRNWLACVARARGSYAKILWSDDLISPDFLARCLPRLRDPRVGFVYTAALMFSGAAPQEGCEVQYQLEGVRDVELPSRRFIEGVFSDGPFPFSPGCALFRSADLARNLWRDIPNRHGSDFSMHAIGNDLLLFLLTAQQYPAVVCVGEPLSQFREHAGSISVTAGHGRLIYHYDLAKAFFAAKVLKDRRLERLLNAHIFMHLRRFGPAPYGMTSVADFSPDGTGAGFGAGALSAWAWSGMRRKVARLLRSRS